jgi:hypothetical protein
VTIRRRCCRARSRVDSEAPILPSAGFRASQRIEIGINIHIRDLLANENTPLIRGKRSLRIAQFPCRNEISKPQDGGFHGASNEDDGKDRRFRAIPSRRLSLLPHCSVMFPYASPLTFCRSREVFRNPCSFGLRHTSRTSCLDHSLVCDSAREDVRSGILPLCGPETVHGARVLERRYELGTRSMGT